MAKGKRARKRKSKINNFTKILIILVIVGLVLSIAPNYINDNQSDNQNIICLLDNNNINDKINDEIKIDEYGNVFMSYEDVRNNLDNTIYMENDSVITIGNTSVAKLKYGENKITINGYESKVLSSMYKDENGKTYIPVSELASVYNIEVNIIDNKVIIRGLDKELIKYDAKKNIDIKYNKTIFSKNVDKVKKGEKLVFVEKCNDWIKVCTQKGIIGYVKEDFLTNKAVIREEMNYSNEDNLNNDIKQDEIYAEKLDLSTYEKREAEISSEVTKCLKNGINMVKINYQNVSNQNYCDRLYIEMLPRLKEIGIKVIK